MKRVKKLFLIFVAVLILLIFFHSLNLLAPLENLVKKGLAPLQVRIYRFGLFLSGRKIGPELAALEIKVQGLMTENVKLQMLEEENERLRQELEFTRQSKNDIILANIIGWPSNGMTSSFIIDKGAGDGLEEGLAVTSHGIFLGKIIKVEKDTAQVLASLASSSQVAALVISQDSEEDASGRQKNIPGLVKGKHGLGMEIELILSEGEAQPGDLIVTSGLENNIPKGLIIGEISQVEAQPGALFQKAVIKPLASFDELSIVDVILP